MATIDYSLIVVYLLVLLALGFARRVKSDSSATEMILGGRVLTLPALVASLVSTWYGGILGVGEFTYLYGVSNWLVFGLPYYLAAGLFAIFLAKRARESEVLTIPDKLAEVYDDKTAALGALIIYFMTVPAAYVLMLGVLAEYLFGWPLWVGVVAGSALSIVYVYLGGFNSVVRTDILQFGLMFVGFAVLLVAAVGEYGGVDFLLAHLPDVHLTWHGGNSGLYIASWYVIALATLIEPAFYQRCYAARTPSVARSGIFISIAAWAVFDFMTTSCGLYARAILPNLTDPVGSFPALAEHLLPAGLLGLFALALLATVMSTVDSYSFLAGSTFGNDLLRRMGWIDESQVTRFTRIGIVVSSVLAIGLALFFRSVVDIWYLFGTLGTPALLVPVFAAFVARNRRLSPPTARVAIVAGALVSAVWVVLGGDMMAGEYLLGVAPIFPGVVVSLSIFLFFARPVQSTLPRQPK